MIGEASIHLDEFQHQLSVATNFLSAPSWISGAGWDIPFSAGSSSNALVPFESDKSKLYKSITLVSGFKMSCMNLATSSNGGLKNFEKVNAMSAAISESTPRLFRVIGERGSSWMSYCSANAFEIDASFWSCTRFLTIRVNASSSTFPKRRST